MPDFEIDLSAVTVEAFQEALDTFNSGHTQEFALSGSGSSAYSLVAGDEVYCTGELAQVAYFWEGYVTGQAEGDTSVEDDLSGS